MNSRLNYNGLIKFKSIIFKFIVSLSVMTITLTYMSIETIKRCPDGLNIGPLDILCNINNGVGILGYPSQIMIIIPTYLYLLINIINFDDTNMYILRNESRREIWNNQVLNSIFLAFIISIIVVIGGYLLCGFLLNDFQNYWADSNGFNYYIKGNDYNWESAVKNFNTIKVLFLVFIGFFIGLGYLGVLVSTMRNIFHSKYIWTILYTIIFFEVLTGKIDFIIKYTTISFEEFANEKIIFFQYMILILITIGLYYLGLYLKNNIDFLDKGEK